jgi:hypothetical protein
VGSSFDSLPTSRKQGDDMSEDDILTKIQYIKGRCDKVEIIWDMKQPTWVVMIWRNGREAADYFTMGAFHSAITDMYQYLKSVTKTR